METPNEVVVILVDLVIGGEPSLFVLLAADGTANRMGNGSVDEIERKMFIGLGGEELLAQLRLQITPGVLHFLGQNLAAPRPKGKLCELAIVLKYADGREAASRWRYGSESQGPHPEVCDFVGAAVRLTEPWFQRQRARAGLNAPST